MSHFFFDESIHQRGGFALGAYVYVKTDPKADVLDVLSRHDLTPLVEEFKSGARSASNPIQSAIRCDFLSLMRSVFAHIGVIVVPYEDRSSLGREALTD